MQEVGVKVVAFSLRGTCDFEFEMTRSLVHGPIRCRNEYR